MIHYRAIRTRQWFYMVVAMLVSLTPLWVGAGLLAIRHNTALTSLSPTFNDEIYYWHQVSTFREAGFEGGYYTVNEVPARLEFSRFYAWGAFVPAVYGILSLPFDWQPNTLNLLNMGLITVSVALMIALTRPKIPVLLVLGVVLGTFVPLVLYGVSSMSEPLHFSLAIGLGAVFARLLQGKPVHRGVVTGVLFVAIMLRPTWAILLFPLWWIGRVTSLKRKALEAVVMVLGVLGAVWVYQGSAAPYENFYSQFLTNPLGLVNSLIDHVLKNSSDLFHIQGTPPVLFQRAQVFLYLLVFFVMLLYKIATRQDNKREIVFHIYQLLAIYGLLVVLYVIENGHDLRPVASHLLLSLVVLALCGRLPLLLISILSVLMTAHVWIISYDGWVIPKTNPAIIQSFEENRPVLEALAPYTPHPNGWCNTVTLSYDFLFHESLMAFDSGIGLSWVAETAPNFAPPETLKARYLWLSDADFTAWQTRLDVKWLARLPQGNLYLNQRAKC